MNEMSIQSLSFQNIESDYNEALSIRKAIPRLKPGPLVKIWIENDIGNYFSIFLNVGDNLRMEIGDIVCPICHNIRSSIDHGRCQRCEDPTSSFAIRLSCMFGKTTSPLIQAGNCVQSNPACGMNSNASYCHSSHILYIGRFGIHFKTGTSRTSRRGGYLQRLIEQGLQEAFVISAFPSLPKALEAEQLLVDLGLASRISTRDKLEALEISDNIELQTLYPFNLVEELFPDKDIIYESLYQLDKLSNLDLFTFISDPTQISGKIHAIVGSLVFIENTSSLMVIDVRDIIHRQLIRCDINEEDLV